MVKIVWTDQAIQDLTDIGEYIANDSERYAREVVQSLFESVQLLKSHPKAGRSSRPGHFSPSLSQNRT